MKHIGNTLYRIIEEKGLVKRTIAINCGINPSYFSQLMAKPSMDAVLLEKICREINISPGYFFDDWTSEKLTIGEITNQTVIGDASINIGENIKYLEEALAAKDKLIEEKERTIKLLCDKAGINL